MIESSNNDFLDGLSTSARLIVEKSADKIHPKIDDTIIHKGDTIGGAFLVESGSLRVYTIDLNGNEKPIYTVNSGELCIFSVNCIFNKILYPAWVTNESANTRILSIPTSAFQRLYEQELFVRDYIVDSLSKRIFDLMSSIEEVSTHDIGQRINSYLVRSCPADRTLKVSHQAIAKHLGTAREVVSRHLKQLEKAGYVELSRLRIRIISPGELSKLGMTSD